LSKLLYGLNLKIENNSTGKKSDKLNFIPGKTYVYLYKNVPKFDLEFLFPNGQISMTWKDRLMFGIPAIGAGISIVLKVLPEIVLIVAVILSIIWGPESFMYRLKKKT
jgi:hypothetical protein